MNRYLRLILLLIASTFLVLIENQISMSLSSTFLSSLLGFGINVHLIFIIYIAFTDYFSRTEVLVIFSWLGLLTDLYYYRTFFVNFVPYLFVFLLVDYLSDYIYNKYIRATILLIISEFLFAVLSFFIALMLQLTSMPLVNVVAFNIAPSIIIDWCIIMVVMMIKSLLNKNSDMT